MKNRLKKITATTAALALAVAVSAGAYLGLGPQTTQANEVPEVSVQSISVTGTIEGATADFMLVANQALEQPLDVQVDISQVGDYMDAEPGAQTFTIDPKSGYNLTDTPHLVVRVHTDDDEIKEDDGTITITMQAGDGYTVGTPSDASVDVADNDRDITVFHNDDNGPKVFIGTQRDEDGTAKKLGDSENLTMYIRPGSNGEKVHYARMFFASDEFDQECAASIGKYANGALNFLYNQPDAEPAKEMQPVASQRNKYSFWGPNHPVVVKNFGHDPEEAPNCYTNGGGMGVFLYNADDELIHTWAPDVQYNKSAFGKNSNGHVIFPFLCGDVVNPDDTKSRVCQTSAEEDTSTWENVGTDWHNPQPGASQFLIRQNVHFSNR